MSGPPLGPETIARLVEHARAWERRRLVRSLLDRLYEHVKDSPASRGVARELDGLLTEEFHELDAHIRGAIGDARVDDYGYGSDCDI